MYSFKRRPSRHSLFSFSLLVNKVLFSPSRVVVNFLDKPIRLVLNEDLFHYGERACSRTLIKLALWN
jgi:hypothetical protein